MAEPWDTLRSLFPDNQTGEISASDMRNQVDLLEANDEQNIKGASEQYIIINPDDEADIATTVNAIIDASNEKRYLIELTAGVHTTSPVTMKPYIYIRGVNKDATVVEAETATDTVFTLADFSMLTDMIVTGATSGKAVYMGVSGHSHCEDFGITNCAIGIHLDHADALLLADVNFNFTVGTAFYITAGNFTLDKAVFFATTVASNLLHATGANTLVTASHIEAFTAGVTTGIRVEDSARVVINNPSIASAGTGIYLSGDSNLVVKGGKIVLCNKALDVPDVAGSPTMELMGLSVQDNIIGANILNPRATVVGNAIGDKTTSFVHPDATITMSVVDLTPGDEGLQIYGELKVGLPGRGSESCLGEGDSYSGSNSVLFYEWDGVGWTDVTEELSSPSGSSWAMPNTNLNTALYMCSTVPDGSAFQRHGGFKSNVLTSLNNADDVTVTGTTTPDATGGFNYKGALNGQPYFERTDQAYWIAFAQGRWGLFPTEPDGSTVRDDASHLGQSLEGDYAPNGSSTGTATVAINDVSPSPLVIEYYNGTDWVDVTFMVTDSDHSYASYAKGLWQLTGNYQIRYNALLDSDLLWIASDPMGLGANYFWTRVRIDSAITSSPELEQMKLHSNRTEINSDGYIEFFGKARPFNRLPWDAGMLEPAASSPGNVDLYVSNLLSRGYVENGFGTGEIIGLNAFLPNQCDTSTPIRFGWSVMSAATHTDVTWTVRWGWTEDGDAIYTSTVGAPVTGPNEQSVTVTAPIDAANTQYSLQVDLDISDMTPAREGSPGDTLWITLERTSGGAGTDIALVNIQPLYAVYVLGGHI